jgi:2-isopropylmalate synthase
MKKRNRPRARPSEGREPSGPHSYDVINANRELNILHSIKGYETPFRILRNYHLIDSGSEPEATIVVQAGGNEIHEADKGVGPVDALANTLKKALKPAFPCIEEVRLIDFAARIHESRSGTKASVEVTLLLSDGTDVWRVSELSQNINQASFQALVEGYEFAIIQRMKRDANEGKGERGRAKAGGGRGSIR